MIRKNFTLNLPYREIEKKDSIKLFANELLSANGVDLAFLFELNKKNRYVFVYEEDGKILAFMTFIDTGKHFHLDLVETNRLYPSKLKPGGKLIILLETMSAHHGFKKITLNSVKGKVPYYKNLGYRSAGGTVIDVIYGTLTKMKKQL